MCFWSEKRNTYDVTLKVVSTWWGGRKVVPTTASEQRKLKAEILKRDRHAIIIDSKVKRQQKQKREMDEFWELMEEMDEEGW